MDIFISYRRDTGASLAKLIETRLLNMGVEAFFDTNNIHNEDFLNKIKRNIDSAPNFLMILTPGYMKKREGDEDYVREELLYALEKGKNILAIAGESYNHNEVDWENETESIKRLKTFNYLTYRNESDVRMEAFFKEVIGNMKQRDGSPFSLKKKVVDNSWYSVHGMDDEDFLWIKTDHTVCRELDWEILEKAITTEPVFKGRDKLNLLVYKAYDIETYRKKYNLRPRKEGEAELPKTIDQVYGVTYRGLLEEANTVFGEQHFIPDGFPSEEYIDMLAGIMRENNISGFDIIDLTLVLKDMPEPEKKLWSLKEFLNPEGGIIYVRELDDDFVDAYPDEKGLIKRGIISMCEKYMTASWHIFHLILP